MQTTRLVENHCRSEDANLLRFFLMRERASRRHHEEVQIRTWGPWKALLYFLSSVFFLTLFWGFKVKHHFENYVYMMKIDQAFTL